MCDAEAAKAIERDHAPRHVGLPLLLPGLVVMLVALIPITYLEARWYHRHLPKLTWEEAYYATMKANLWSTLIGIPLTWLVLFAVELAYFHFSKVGPQSLILAESLSYSYFHFFITAPWIMPVQSGGLGQVMLGAMMVLMVPCFVISYIGEAWVLAKHWPEQDKALLRRHSWYAHCITYGILFGLAWWRFATL